MEIMTDSTRRNADTWLRVSTLAGHYNKQVGAMRLSYAALIRFSPSPSTSGRVISLLRQRSVTASRFMLPYLLMMVAFLGGGHYCSRQLPVSA
ncbi:hypothetical protein, partial [Pseudonocardia sp. TMWB2A]|uniref:hypothetical protein n=1 Tax=Pseudonocardia sp. TMWB2A TaxID=687430 RepID=UPI00307E4089